MIDTPHDKVMQFHETYGLPIARLYGIHGTPLNRQRRLMRVDLIVEEVQELVDASGLSLDAPRASQQYYDGDKLTLELQPIERHGGNLIEMADALGDIVYVCYGMAIEMGINLDDVIAEIHKSNMSKLGADGKPIYREDGKVLKGPNYREPDIAKVIFF